MLQWIIWLLRSTHWPMKCYFICIPSGHQCSLLSHRVAISASPIVSFSHAGNDLPSNFMTSCQITLQLCVFLWAGAEWLTSWTSTTGNSVHWEVEEEEVAVEGGGVMSFIYAAGRVVFGWQQQQQGQILRLIGVISILNTINDSSFSSSSYLIVGDNYCWGPHLHK